jgi:hypothetical protein
MPTQPGQSVTRAELESDEAFLEAEDVLMGFFGEPPREEEWADVYGGIVDAVLTKLATLQPIHASHTGRAPGPTCPGRSVFGNPGSLVPR